MCWCWCQAACFPLVLRHGGRCPCCAQVQFIDGYDAPMVMRVQRSAPHLADLLRTGLGVQIVPASCSSSELSSHQMAIRSHPRVQRNARQWHFIRAERSSNGSCRTHRALEASSLPSCFVPFFFLPRLATPALRLGVIGSLRPSVFFLFLCLYGCRSGQPSSSSLARRACIHVLTARRRRWVSSRCR